LVLGPSFSVSSVETSREASGSEPPVAEGVPLPHAETSAPSPIAKGPAEFEGEPRRLCRIRRTIESAPTSAKMDQEGERRGAARLIAHAPEDDAPTAEEASTQ
jgi:hypothetical protein